jgi:hypothetical protein
MRSCGVWYISTDVSDDPAASIVGVRVYGCRWFL